jgi:hypothetical protein
VGTNATPGLQALFEMARWRAGFIRWHDQAMTATRSFSETASIAGSSATNSATP